MSLLCHRREEKEKNAFTLSTKPLEYEQNDRKVKGRISKNKERKKRILSKKTSACENHHRSVPEGPSLKKGWGEFLPGSGSQGSERGDISRSSSCLL